MEEADQLCEHVAFIVNGRLVANDRPRNLKLAHGQRALSVTLEEVLHAQNGDGPFNETTLSLDDPADQQRLAQWMTQGKVRAVHSREATLEEVFIEVAGIHLALGGYIMHIRSILAIAHKDALDILLNKTTLTLLLTPIFLAVLFVVIGELLGGHTTNALVYNPAKSGVEQVIDSAFSDIKVTYTNSPADVAAAFGPDGSHKNTTLRMLMVAPASFADIVAAKLLGNNPFSQAIRVLPTYYLADGAANAIQAQSTFSGTVLDIGVILASILVLFLVAVWSLRRQAAVVSTI
jgi:hypothetical protein